jgi:uroporphyrinogen-III synthase
MSQSLIIVRPEPGNSATSAKARERGLQVQSFPLFETAAIAWDAPDPARYVGVIMTSANAARLAGPDLQRYVHLPLYAVGDVTGDAAREAGFVSIVSGDGDVERLLGKIATLGLHRLLHLAGADYHDFTPHGVEIERQIVYASNVIAPAPELLAALRQGGVVMLHSPRAGRQLAALVQEHGVDPSTLSLAAISANAAEAAGTGWSEIRIAARPHDRALLDSAVALCATQKIG